jgi:hypothetical protein
LESLKPLLIQTKTALILRDKIVQVGDRYYVEATARLQDCESDAYIDSVAYAREDESKKGQDLSQTTGSTSSYARKYALNGLFCIDDNKDSDSTNKHDKEELKEESKSEEAFKKVSTLTDAQIRRAHAIASKKGIDADKIKAYVKAQYKKESLKDITKAEYDSMIEYIESKPDKESALSTL